MNDTVEPEKAPPDKFEDALSNPHNGLRALLLRPVEVRLKVPHSTIMLLLEEPNDWVFITKLGLLAEAALTEYLVLELGRPEAYEHISGTDQAKRLKLADALGLLEKDDRDVLQTLAEVRNQFVHKLENMSKPLAEYMHGLTVNRKNQLCAILLGADLLKDIKACKADPFQVLANQFREVLLDRTVLPLISLSARHNEQLKRKERAEWEAANPARSVFEFKHPPSPSLQI